MKDGGFPNDTLKQMGKNLEPEHSMLAMVVDYSAREQAESDLRAAGGTIVSHTLDVRMAQDLDEAVAADHADDLTIIEGIGPKIMERLNENGIKTFADLADTDVERLRAILAEGGSQFRLADPASWPRQARLAADRDWVRLAALKQEMVGGVR
jgi:predicted flap endonuclease-1-like 5' DNA nuclease